MEQLIFLCSESLLCENDAATQTASAITPPSKSGGESESSNAVTHGGASAALTVNAGCAADWLRISFLKLSHSDRILNVLGEHCESSMNPPPEGKTTLTSFFRLTGTSPVSEGHDGVTVRDSAASIM